MTTPKPDGAGPTDEELKKVVDEIVYRYVQANIKGNPNALYDLIYKALASERAEAEKKIKELEQRLLRDETVDYRAEQAYWILMKQVKDLELLCQATNNVARKMCEKAEYMKMHRDQFRTEVFKEQVNRICDQEIEKEFQRLKHGTK